MKGGKNCYKLSFIPGHHVCSFLEFPQIIELFSCLDIPHDQNLITFLDLIPQLLVADDLRPIKIASLLNIFGNPAMEVVLQVKQIHRLGPEVPRSFYLAHWYSLEPVVRKSEIGVRQNPYVFLSLQQVKCLDLSI